MANGNSKAKAAKPGAKFNLLGHEPMAKITVTSSVFDLDSFDEVNLIKEKEFTPATSAKEVMERVGGDAEKFLSILNNGLLAGAKTELKNDSTTPWSAVDEDGKPTGPFTGTPANMKSVNSLVLTLAKTIFGYAKDAPVEKKRGAKDSAIEMIRGNEDMKNGLKRSAVADSE